MRQRLGLCLLVLGAGLILAGSLMDWSSFGCLVLLGYEPSLATAGCGVSFWELMTVGDVVLGLSASSVILAAGFMLVRELNHLLTFIAMTAAGTVVGVLLALGSPLEAIAQDGIYVRDGGVLALVGATVLLAGCILLCASQTSPPVPVTARVVLAVVAIAAPAVNLLPVDQGVSIWEALLVGDLVLLLCATLLVAVMAKPAAQSAPFLTAALAGGAFINGGEFIGLSAAGQLAGPVGVGAWLNLVVGLVALVTVALIARHTGDAEVRVAS